MPNGDTLYLPSPTYHQNTVLNTGSSMPLCANWSGSMVASSYGDTFGYGGDDFQFKFTVSSPTTAAVGDCHRVVWVGCSFAASCTVEVLNADGTTYNFVLTPQAAGEPNPTSPVRADVASPSWWSLDAFSGTFYHQEAGVSHFTLTFTLADNASAQFVSGSDAGAWAFLQGDNWGMAVPFNVADASLRSGEARRVRRRRDSTGGMGINSSGLPCIPCWVLQQLLGMLGSSIPMQAMGLDLSYVAEDAGMIPNSPGYGWGLGQAYSKVLKQVDPDDGTGPYLQFNDGSGSYDRWTITNPGSTETYTPLYADTYTRAFLETDSSITLVMQNLTVMKFHMLDSSPMAGRLLSKKDNSGNSVTFNHDTSTGLLTSVVDSDGHAMYVNYGTRTDGQPVTLYSQSTSSPNFVTFGYDSTSSKLTSITSNVFNPVDSSTTSYGYTFGYDSATGQLNKIVDPRSTTMVQYEFYPSTDPAAGLVQTEYHSIPSGDPTTAALRRLDYVYAYNSDGISGKISLTDTDQTAGTSRTVVNSYNLRRLMTETQVTVASAPDGSYVWAYEYQDTLSPYLMTKSLDPNLNQTLVDWDDLGNPTAITDAMGHVTSYAYTGFVSSDSDFHSVSVELLSQVTPPTLTGQAAGYGATSLFYDTSGNVVRIEDALLKYTSYTRRSSDGRITAITDRNGPDNGTNPGDIGNVGGRYNGNVLEIAYSTAVSGVSNAGNVTSVTFATGQTSPTPPSAPLTSLSFGYDLYDNVTSVTDPLANSVSTSWDSLNRMVKTQPLPPSGIPGNDNTVYNYSAELLDHVDLPNNSVTPSTSSGRRELKFGYDVANRLNLIQGLPQPLMSGTLQTIVGYGYDAYNNLTSLSRLKRPGGIGVPETLSWGFTYDELDRSKTATDTLSSPRTTTTTYPEYCLQYTVNTPRVETVYSFDTICRLVEIDSPGETDLVTYDEWNRVIMLQQENGAASRYSLRGATGGDVAQYGPSRYQDSRLPKIWHFQYDALSRLKQVTFPDTTTLVYNYDNEGNVLSTTDPNLVETTYTYYPYPDYRLHTVEVPIGGSPQTWTYSYDGAGRLSELDYPNGLAAKFSDTVHTPPLYGWDYKGQLLGINYTLGGSTLQSFSYTYDNSGNRLSCTDNSTTTSYGYDGFNRLVSAGSNSYSYDESDNRMTATLPAGSYTYTVDGADQLVSRSLSGGGTDSFSYDGDGNLLSSSLSGGPNSSFLWDDRSKAIRIQDGSNLQTNTYGIDGLRRGTDPSTTYYNSGSMAIADNRPSPQNPVSFIQGHQLLGFQANGALYTYVTDALGSVRHVLDNSGSVVYSFTYDEFGNQTSSTDGTGGNATLAALCQMMTFVGAYGVRNETAKSGLYLMGQRWYDPSVGRFISQDPIGFAGGPNLYGYVNSNSINRTDPSGTSAADAAQGYTDGLLWAIALDTAGISVPPLLVAGLVVAGVYGYLKSDSDERDYALASVAGGGVMGLAEGAINVVSSLIGRAEASGLAPSSAVGQVGGNCYTRIVALGLRKGGMLQRFAARFGAELAGNNFRPWVKEAILDPQTQILFNLEEYDAQQAYRNLMRDTPSATDEELGFINKNPGTWHTIEFRSGESPAQSPLPLPSTNYKLPRW